MTIEDQLQKLEEKMMTLLSEFEQVREQNELLIYENTSLKTERENQKMESKRYEEELKKRIEGLLSLFETVRVVEPAIPLANTNIAA